jgi:hypothetical protein
LPHFLVLAEERANRPMKIARNVAVAVFVLFTLVALGPALGYLAVGVIGITLVLAIPIGLFTGLAMVQTAIEEVVARRILTWKHPRRTFAWFEAVMITFGVCTVMLWTAGWTMTTDTRTIELYPPALWLNLFVNYALAVAVQWWVVRTQARNWGDELPARRLLIACMLAKAVTSMLWLFCPLQISRL